MEEKIIDIISRSLGDQPITSDEKQELENWLSDDGNKRFYSGIEMFSVNTKEALQKPQANVDQAFLKHLDKMKKSKSVVRMRFLRKAIPYAASIMLIIGLFSVMMYLGHEDSGISQEEKWLAEIEPGTNKATLVLADGSTVDLEEEKDTLIAGKALNKNNTLTYNSKSEELESTNSMWHKLVVPVGGEYQLQLSDGTKVWLNSDSELRYTDQFVGKKRIVHLKGEAFFEVSKDKERPFIVKTSTMDVRVYGTEFNVMAYEDENLAQTTLVEGSIGVNLKNEMGIVQTEMLEPDMQIEYLRGNVKGKLKEVQASLYTGWKDGKFQFNNEELGSIMRKLSRWYGVKFFTQNQDLQKIKFSGEMKRFDDFSTILKLLEIGSDVEFEVKGKTVTVRGVYR